MNAVWLSIYDVTTRSYTKYMKETGQCENQVHGRLKRGVTNQQHFPIGIN